MAFHKNNVVQKHSIEGISSRLSWHYISPSMISHFEKDLAKPYEISLDNINLDTITFSIISHFLPDPIVWYYRGLTVPFIDLFHSFIVISGNTRSTACSGMKVVKFSLAVNIVNERAPFVSVLYEGMKGGKLIFHNLTYPHWWTIQLNHLFIFIYTQMVPSFIHQFLVFKYLL